MGGRLERVTEGTIIKDIPGFNVREVIVAGDRGPCGGVNMAIEGTFEVLQIVGGRERVIANNEPVHNDLITEEFKEMGLEIIREKNLSRYGQPVLSAHGTDPKDKEGIDFECQLVTKNRNVAEKIWREELGEILYFCIPGHPEVESIINSLAKGIITLVDMKQDLETVSMPDAKRIYTLSQTTVSFTKVQGKVDEFRKLYPTRNILDPIGICYATDNRQNAVRNGIFGNPQKPIDMLIVVGSQKSHNSNELRNIGDEFLEEGRSHLINKPDDINPHWFNEGIQRVGLTSGASVLERFTDRVVQWFRDRGVDIEYLEGTEKDLIFKKPVKQIEELRRRMEEKYGTA